MRKAVASGQFYPSDRLELKEKIDNLLKKAGIKGEKKTFGIISPHAGYEYSGQAAAFSYKTISKQKFDTFIILGVNHSGSGNRIAVSGEDFEIPSGIAETDKEFCNELIKIYGESKTRDYEHSIEVQLPFLLYLFGKIKIVPIALSLDDYEECAGLAEILEKIIKKLKRKICVIASSDFTHYGAGYGFVPFSGTDEKVKKKLYEMDGKAIKLIEKMKSEEFFEASRNMTICGAAPIAVAIELCKKLGAKKAKLLKYYTSGDISGDYSASVGYASMIFV